MNAQKTCYHCDRVLDEAINPLDPLGGVHGQCQNCREFKAAWYAEFKKSTGNSPATAEKTNP